MRKFVFLASEVVGIAALASTLVLAGLLVIPIRAYASPLPVEFGTAGNYSVLGGTGVVNTLNTVLNADLGVSPSKSISGFSPPGVVDGETHAGDPQAAQAQSDLVLAYNAAVQLTPTGTFSGDQIGATFDAGIYFTPGAFALTGTMTLDGQGNPNAVFIFQVDAALNTAASTTISLINGAQASNVFWQVNGAVTTGESSSFTGTIMAAGAITVGDGGSIAGRALSFGIVTLADNLITTPDIIAFASPPTPAISLTNTTTDSVRAAGIPGDSGSIAYTSNTPSICSVSLVSGALTYLSSGTCTIQATQAADAAQGDALTTATTNITVTAPPAFSVTFNANGSATTGSTATETDNVPSALTLNGFSRTGYTFAGWNTVALGGGTPYADGATYPFGAALTLYAQWTADPAFSVTFNANGSATTGSTATETDNVPSALTLNGFSRTGYSFAGWNTVALGGGTPYADGATYPFGAALTLYAQWTADPAFSVTFNANGSATTGSTATETDNVPSALTLNGFSRTGYTFAGWNTVALGGGTPYADGATYPFGAALTLYAQWTADPAFSVTFNANGSATTGSTATETDNVPSALTLNGFSRTGYTFAGWNTVALGGGTPYADGATYPFGAALTLYAQWTADPAFSVTFNANGSATTGSTATETDNVPSALTLNGFSRTGYTFAGWNTVALGGGTPYADGATYPFGAALTLYAQWTADPAGGDGGGGGGGGTTSPPSITGMIPAVGSSSGGTKVSITGSNFSGATVVMFGGTAAINVMVVNSTTITAVSPVGTAGLVNVTVTTPGGTSSASHADNFTYVSAAPITLIQGSPTSATVADGAGYSGQRAVTNATGTVSYTETISADSTDVVVSSTGEISASTALSPGTYSVSGNDSDTNGDTGTWTFALAVTVTTPAAPTGTAGEYDLVGSDGGVFVFGQPGTGFYGSLPGLGIHVNDIVGMVITRDKKGYYLVGSDGGVFAFGDATFDGSLPGIGVHVNDIVGISPTADGGGYFLVGKDGGVFAFGDAPFEGSLPGLGTHVDNIVGFAATTSNRGYWIVGSGGIVFAFGDATNFGSAPGPVTSISSTPGGGGYWLTGPDGGVFAFGDAPFEGSLPGMGVEVNNIISMVPSSDGKGYLLIGMDGGVFALGDALFEGSLPGIGIHLVNVVGAVSTATELGQ